MIYIKRKLFIPIFNVLLRLASLFSKLFIVLILSRELNSYDFGYYGLFTAIIVYSVGFIGFEFHTYSNRALLISTKTHNEIITNHIIFSLIAITISVPAFFAVFHFELLLSSLAIYFIGILFFEYLALELSRVFNILGSQIVSSILLFVRTSVWIMPACYLFINDEQYQTLDFVLGWWFAGAVLSFFIGLFYLLIFYKYKFSFSYADKPWIIEGIKKSSGMFISAQAVLLLFVMDRYLIKFDVGVELASIYMFYFGLTNALLALFESSFFVFYTPKILYLYSNDKINEINSECSKLLKMIVICCLLVVISSYLVIDYIIEFVGKLEYVEFKNVFFLLLLSVLIRVISLVYHFAIYAIKKDKYLININLVSLVLYPALFYLFNSSLHALYAASITMLCINILHLFFKRASWVMLVKRKSE